MTLKPYVLIILTAQTIFTTNGFAIWQFLSSVLTPFWFQTTFHSFAEVIQVFNLLYGFIWKRNKKIMILELRLRDLLWKITSIWRIFCQDIVCFWITIADILCVINSVLGYWSFEHTEYGSCFHSARAFIEVLFTAVGLHNIIVLRWIRLFDGKCTWKERNYCNEEKSKKTHPCKHCMSCYTSQYRVLVVPLCKIKELLRHANSENHEFAKSHLHWPLNQSYWRSQQHLAQLLPSTSVMWI